MESFARKLTIQLDIDKLHEQRIQKLQETLKAFKGKHPLNFVVYEMQEAIKVNLTSRKQKVHISSELLHELKDQEVHYKLN
jgi:DNA polymerase-3 subunit alpha